MKRAVWSMLALACGLAGVRAAAEDWPNWRGLHKDGISRETGLAKSWPATGPKIAWKRALPGGYSSPAIAKGRLVCQSKEGVDELVLCLDSETGEPIWEYRYPADYEQHPTLDQRFKSGPRATPTIEGARVYTVGTTGVFLCLDVKTGKVIWKQNLLEIASRTIPDYGYVHSPLIVGDSIYVSPGGPNGKSLAALDKRDGRILWTALDDPIGYSTPIYVKVGNQPQIVHFTATGLVSVTPDAGKELWRYSWKTDFDLNCATPIYTEGPLGQTLFISSNYGHGAALIRLKPEGGIEQIYTTKNMMSHINTPVAYQGHVYGFSMDRLRCLDLATGNILWEQRGLTRGSQVLVDGHLVVWTEKGELLLVEASPKAYVEKARAPIMGGINWAMPAFANGKCYLQNDKAVVAVDLRG